MLQRVDFAAAEMRQRSHSHRPKLQCGNTRSALRRGSPGHKCGLTAKWLCTPRTGCALMRASPGACAPRPITSATHAMRADESM
jgi:hypothetical protein